jgi:3-oxoacyl-(acyl-carrier-protein) synthase/acyl carrier protein
MQPVAIVGASCRFPGSNGLDEFWQLLREGRNAVTIVPDDRWDRNAALDDDPAARTNTAIRYGGFIKGIRDFDCAFFGISPREAAAMDPQQRLLLETTYEALEDAGVPMEALAGSKTAVYVGIGPGDYGRMCAARPPEEIDAHYVTGNFLSTAVDRIAYFFDLRGAAMAVDTACSSSLVALHLACRSLEHGEADLALAGGVNALLAPILSISLARAGALSPTGACRAFDAGADGYVRGEGAGFVVLKRLDEAIADRDRIYAVVRGTAVMQGGRRNGLTAPGGWGEEAVMQAAWDAAGISPTQAEYVEAQGTGTLLGDAIEANAVSRVFGARNGSGPCRIGSVKTNIGHLETAAGVAGVIKSALMLSRGEFVPSRFPEKSSPHIHFEKLGLTVQTGGENWQLKAPSSRLAGVSSFGMGGTCAHVCMSGFDGEATVFSAENGDENELLIPLSARHPDALRMLVGEVATQVEKLENASVLDLCRAAALRRSHHEYRAAFAGSSPEKLTSAMRRWQNSKPQLSRANSQRRLLALIPWGEQAADGSNPTLGTCKALYTQTISEKAGSSRVLDRLEQWGIRPRSFHFKNGRIVITPDDEHKSPDRSADAREIEIGTLAKLGDDFLDLTRDNVLVSSREIAKASVISAFSLQEPQLAFPSRIAAELYARGYDLAWRNIYPGPAKQINFPRYPWQHQVCWSRSLNSKPATISNSAAKNKQVPPTRNLRDLLSRITGIPAQEIRFDASPTELGIDSLLTLELQQKLKSSFGKVIPVEALVTLNSVGELELLLEKDSENSVWAHDSASSMSRAGRRISTEIREASLADYEQIAALAFRNGLGIKTRSEWEHLWIDNPVYKKEADWPMGWVAEHSSEIVGFLGSIPLTYSFKGEEILASGLHAFSLDASHRGYGLILVNRLLQAAPRVEYFVGSTTNANSSKVLDRLGICRVPVGEWGKSAFWITSYEGFISSAALRKRVPVGLERCASIGLNTYDKLLKRAWPRQVHELQRQSTFDERFDLFWAELKAAYPDRLLATRSREILEWHFNFSLAQNRTWVVTHERDSRILAYAIFQRQDSAEINLQRMRLIDFQALPGNLDILPSVLGWALRECRAEGIHMLEAFGFRPEKQRTIDRFAHHRRKFAWGYFHNIVSAPLQSGLQNSDIWDPSQFDGDASL